MPKELVTATPRRKEPKERALAAKIQAKTRNQAAGKANTSEDLGPREPIPLPCPSGCRMCEGREGGEQLALQ